MSAEATLELTVLYPDTLKSKLKLVAWVDKRSPKTLTLTLTLDTPATLHLPLSSLLLRNPSSSLTVQILSPSRLPFRPSLLLASASLPLSSLPLLAADALALPFLLPRRRRRQRGGPCVVRVAVRVLWPLGVAPDDRPAEPVGGAVEFVAIEPSAPPLPTAAAAAAGGAWRSFLVGLASGAIAAAAAVGVLGLLEV